MSQITVNGFAPFLLLGIFFLQACGDDLNKTDVDADALTRANTTAATSVLFGEDFDSLTVDTQPNNWDNFLGYVYKNTNKTGQANYALLMTVLPTVVLSPFIFMAARLKLCVSYRAVLNAYICAPM
jgi:hypothetical protein